MITYYLLIIVTGILGGLISPLFLFPEVTLSPNIASSFAMAGQYIHMVHTVIPILITTLFSVLALYISIEAAIGIYKLIRWIYQKFPTIN